MSFNPGDLVVESWREQDRNQAGALTALPVYEVLSVRDDGVTTLLLPANGQRYTTHVRELRAATDDEKSKRDARGMVVR